MTTLADHQFELLANEDASDGVAFGIGCPVHVTADGFDPGSDEILTQDSDNPRRGTIVMGRDARKASPWTWALFVNAFDATSALTTMAELEAAWKRGAWNVGEVAVIRYMLGGRIRRVFGRPRRWASTMNNLILSGMVPITADFQRVDPMYYGDQMESDTLDMLVTSAGGVVYPVVYPLISMPSGSNEGELHVGGSEPTYPIIRFTGPIVNPELITANWTLKLNATIADGEWVEIDTRPWVMSIRNQSGAAVPGLLDPRLRMRDLVLYPGTQSATLRGISNTGMATCSIKRYPAYLSI